MPLLLARPNTLVAYEAHESAFCAIQEIRTDTMPYLCVRGSVKLKEPVRDGCQQPSLAGAPPSPQAGCSSSLVFACLTAVSHGRFITGRRRSEGGQHGSAAATATLYGHCATRFCRWQPAVRVDQPAVSGREPPDTGPGRVRRREPDAAVRLHQTRTAGLAGRGQSWRTAAVPMENPCCSCKLTRDAEPRRSSRGLQPTTRRASWKAVPAAGAGMSVGRRRCDGTCGCHRLGTQVCRSTPPFGGSFT